MGLSILRDIGCPASLRRRHFPQHRASDSPSRTGSVFVRNDEEEQEEAAGQGRRQNAEENLQLRRMLKGSI